MMDTYGRTIDYLRVSITDRCNLRCQYCMKEEGVVHKPHREIVSYEQLQLIIRCAVEMGMKKVRITGGEPLVRKGAIGFIQEVSKLEGLEELCLTTNGTYLKSYAEALKEAKVKRINISLDTLDEKKYKQMTRGGNLHEVWEGIQSALSICEKVKLNVVYMKGFNDDEVKNFLELTRNYPLDVRFIELMPIGEAMYMQECAESLEQILDEFPLLQKKGVEGVSVVYQLPDALGKVGLIRPMSHSFCSSCNRLRITADGKLKPCLFADIEYDLKNKNEEEIKQIFQLAIEEKPVSKDAVLLTQRNMNEIGG